jgi:hypothetical protein
VEDTGGRRLRPHDYHPGDEKRCAHAGQNRCSARIARENLAWRRRRLVCSWRARHLGQHWPMKIAALHKMEPLGGRKPSELLVSMLELCPRGHESSIFLMHLFLERLPAELRITLAEDDHQNVQALAEKVDALWSLHGMKSSFSSAVASLVDVDEPSQVEVVSARGLGRSCSRGCGGHGGQACSSWGGGQQHCGQQVTSQYKAAASLLPREMACIQSGHCLYHFNHGEKAHSCMPPCNCGLT